MAEHSEAQRDMVLLLTAAGAYVLALEATDEPEDAIIHEAGKLAILLIEKMGGIPRLKEAMERLGNTAGIGSPFSVQSGGE